MLARSLETVQEEATGPGFIDARVDQRIVRFLERLEDEKVDREDGCWQIGGIAVSAKIMTKASKVVADWLEARGIDESARAGDVDQPIRIRRPQALFLPENKNGRFNSCFGSCVNMAL